jgi:hypothetical protein
MASFSSGQQVDRAKYDALNDSVNPVTSDSIPMDSRGAWGERHERPGYGHMHKESAASMSDVMNQPVHQPRDGFNYNTYPQQSADGYDGYDDALSAPRQAYTNDPGPTPKFSNAIYGGPSTMDAPPQVQSHPGEHKCLLRRSAH